jgi:hypothetical protein
VLETTTTDVCSCGDACEARTSSATLSASTDTTAVFVRTATCGTADVRPINSEAAGASERGITPAVALREWDVCGPSRTSAANASRRPRPRVPPRFSEGCLSADFEGAGRSLPNSCTRSNLTAGDPGEGAFSAAAAAIAHRRLRFDGVPPAARLLGESTAKREDDDSGFDGRS